MNEFDVIDKYFTWKKYNNNVIESVGDDCAVLSFNKRILISTDTLVGGVHFLSDALADDVAYKALAVNLSDIAAMGGSPKSFTLSLVMPNINNTWLATFSLALKKLAAKYHIDLIGGDIARGALSITITIIGECKQAILRRGAKIGDGIFVSGDLGGAAFALRSINNNQVIDIEMLNKLMKPEPQIFLGLQINGIANSCIDISDGLLQDLNHILTASKVGADIISNKIPVAINATLNDALNGGDDYQLCFSAPADKINIKNVTKIGVISKKLGLRVDGISSKINGYQHFKDTNVL